jgi:hypothetical protein
VAGFYAKGMLQRQMQLSDIDIDAAALLLQMMSAAATCYNSVATAPACPQVAACAALLVQQLLQHMCTPRAVPQLLQLTRLQRAR